MPFKEATGIYNLISIVLHRHLVLTSGDSCCIFYIIQETTESKSTPNELMLTLVFSSLQWLTDIGKESINNDIGKQLINIDIGKISMNINVSIIVVLISKKKKGF